MKNRNDFDIIFISYDEPNADENWKHLKRIVPKAARVNNIKGIDKAHKKAARLATTEHFFVIDGDTQVKEDFFNQPIEDLNSNYVYSWSAKNIVNGLVYGNGGAKLWPKHIMENIKSHEINGETDFCWIAPYYQVNETSSTTIINSTPIQAFRAGFREGARLSLNQGQKVKNPKTDVWIGNYLRLLTWTNIGIDVENGLWAMLGARIGCYEICRQDLDINLISDYNWINGRWKLHNDKLLKTELTYYGNLLRRLLGIPVTTLNEEASIFAKLILHNPSREGLMLPELGEEEYLKKMGFWKA